MSDNAQHIENPCFGEENPCGLLLGRKNIYSGKFTKVWTHLWEGGFNKQYEGAFAQQYEGSFTKEYEGLYSGTFSRIRNVAYQGSFDKNYVTQYEGAGGQERPTITQDH